jgi:hypothetical protein
VDSRDLSSQIPGVTIQPFLGGNFGTGAIVDIAPSVGDVEIEPAIGDIIDTTATEVSFTMGIEGPDQSAFELKGTKKIDELDVPLPIEDLFESGAEFSLKIHGSGEYSIDEAFGQEEDLIDMHGSEEFDFIELADGTEEVELLDDSGKVVFKDIETGIDEDGIFDEEEVSFNEATHHIVEHDFIDKAEVLDEKVIAEFENSAERASLLQAEGAYDQAKAARDISKINSVKTVLESSNESDKDSADGQITSRSDISLVPVSPKPEESLSSSQENSDSDGETNNNIIVPDDEIPLPGAVQMNDYTNNKNNKTN